MKPIHLVLVVLVLAIGVMLFLWPRHLGLDTEKEQSYIKRINILKAEKADSEAAIDSISIRYIERSRKDSVFIKAQNKEIARLKKKDSEAEAAIPIEAHEQYPQIQAALTAKDSVIAAVEVKADSLEQSLMIRAKDFSALRGQVEIDRGLAQRMMQECEARNAELQEALARMREKPKALGWKILGTAGAAFGIWQAAKNAADN